MGYPNKDFTCIRERKRINRQFTQALSHWILEFGHIRSTMRLLLMRKYFIYLLIGFMSDFFRRILRIIVFFIFASSIILSRYINTRIHKQKISLVPFDKIKTVIYTYLAIILTLEENKMTPRTSLGPLLSISKKKLRKTDHGARFILCTPRPKSNKSLMMWTTWLVYAC